MDMKKSPIYEQVSGGKPGEKFVASGLYRHVGNMSGGRFERVRSLALKTMQQWLAVANAPAADTPTAVRQSRCPMCMGYLSMTPDVNGDVGPCPGCGWYPTAAPLPDGDAHNTPVVTFSAPDTLTRMLKIQQDAHAVTETVAVPVVAQVATPRTRQTFAPRGSTLDRVVAAQTALGRRAAPAPMLRTAVAQLPCPRCGSKTTCQCPPTPPRTLELIVARQAQALAAHEASMSDAGYPAIRPV
jgi:hypothetical protein